MKLYFMKDMVKMKLSYAGYVMRGSSGLSHLQILEGKIDGAIKVDSLRRTWMKNTLKWTGQSTYGLVRNLAEREKRDFEKYSW